jgi:Diacylglycerol kinase catalytic domain
VLEFLYSHFNPCQVIDLLDGELSYLSIFKNVPNVRVVIGGGDGTVGSLGDVVLKLLGDKVPVIPMPLGTGNDLSRALGWGPGISDLEDVKLFLEGLEGARKDIYMDRWRIMAVKGVHKNLVDIDEKSLK